MKKPRPSSIDWDDIVDYIPYITVVCTRYIPYINHKDEAIGLEDLIQECLLHTYNHKDRYDSNKGGVGTFIRMKTRQQLFKIDSKSKTYDKKLKELWDLKFRELEQIEELDELEPDELDNY
jgi:hypothetical protein